MIAAIINYGMGNTFSVKQTIEKIGFKVFIANHPSELKKASKIILPGVGAFNKAMKNLNADGWVEALAKFVKKDKVVLSSHPSSSWINNKELISENLDISFSQ